jgi:hypothetical protein
MNYSLLNEFIITGGLRAGCAINISKNINYYLFGGEIGYRYIGAEKKVYVSVSMDILLYLTVLVFTEIKR